MREREKREAARIIVRDSQERILLFKHARLNGETFWATPGGGLENGETFEQGALREASEELGVSDIALKFLWERVTRFHFH